MHFPGTTNNPSHDGVAAAVLALLLAGGHIGLPILVLIMLFSKRIRRPPSVINFCIIWIIFSISYSLTIYDGHAVEGTPPFALCLTQAAMIHSAPPMAVVAALAIVCQVWHTFQAPWHPAMFPFVSRIPSYLRVMAVVVPPYIVFMAFAVYTTWLGLKLPETVRPSARGTYCTVVETSAQLSVPIFCAAVMTLILLLNIALILRYIYGLRLVKQLIPLAQRRISLGIWFRVTLFNLYTFAALAASVVLMLRDNDPFPYVIEASLPLAATIVFGSQTDILRVLCFWKKPNKGEIRASHGGWMATEEDLRELSWTNIDESTFTSMTSTNAPV